MKKLLLTILFTLVLSENAYALKFYNCYVKKTIDKDTERFLIERGTFGKFDSSKFEDSYYQIYKDGSAEQVIIKTDKWLKESNDWIDKEYKDVSYATPEFLATMKQKINKFNYKVTFINEKYITLEPALKIAQSKVNINLKNGEVTYVGSDGSFNSLKQCEMKTKTNQGYLDYWWALILIIAITFFVYTQSALRLKKIKIRKK